MRSDPTLQVRYLDAHDRRAAMMDYGLRVKEDNLQAVQRLAEERARCVDEEGRDGGGLPCIRLFMM